MTEPLQRTWATLLEPMLQPVLDPGSRTYWPLLLVAAGIACIVQLHHTSLSGPGLVNKIWAAVGGPLWRHRSSIMDLQLLIARRLLGLIGLLPRLGSAYVLATSLVIWLDRTLGQPDSPDLSPAVLSTGYTLVLFVVWDFSRAVLHWLMHRVPLLWQFHQVHHSAEVLTPLTFHRVHPVESMMYGLRSVLTTGLLAGLAFWLYRGTAVELTVLGVHGLGFVLNSATGNLRHSHVYLSFGPSLERWLLSPAQHQVHHSKSPERDDHNFGTWLACWDRMAGTLKIAPSTRPEIGLDSSNHAPDDLLGALLRPFAAGLHTLRPRRWAALLLLGMLSGAAQAEDSADSTEDDPADGTMIITAQGKPRIAGAAHVIDQEELERHRYTDIHQILATVPGVYLRGEDGFGLRPNIGLRGGNSDRSAKITLMEDGVLMAPAPYAAPAAYYFPLSARLVGVEVIKGAAAIRYGPQTIGGAINLLTRQVPMQNAAAISSAYGLHNTVSAHGHTGTGGERWGVLAEIAHLSSDGFKQIDGGGQTGFGRQDAMFKARIGSLRSATVFHDLELKLGYGRERSHETYLADPRRHSSRCPDRRLPPPPQPRLVQAQPLCRRSQPARYALPGCQRRTGRGLYGHLGGRGRQHDGRPAAHEGQQ
jgi:sterol desaturase/sphingolipid hydroxylase (fatty acid hydroxylase superfamily)